MCTSWKVWKGQSKTTVATVIYEAMKEKDVKWLELSTVIEFEKVKSMDTGKRPLNKKEKEDEHGLS